MKIQNAICVSIVTIFCQNIYAWEYRAEDRESSHVIDIETKEGAMRHAEHLAQVYANHRAILDEKRENFVAATNCNGGPICNLRLLEAKRQFDKALEDHRTIEDAAKEAAKKAGLSL